MGIDFGLALATTFTNGVNLRTDYSGVGTPEVALAHIQTAMERLGLNTGRGLRCSAASDIEASCRRILKAHVGRSRPACVFGDILERLPAHVLSDVKRLLDVHKRAAEEAIEECGAARRRDVIHRFGRSFAKAAFDSFAQEATMNPFDAAQSRAWCFACKRKCPVFPCANEDAERRVAVGGVICYDWSNMGFRRGWLSDSAVVFLAWLRERTISREHIIVVECVPGFDHGIFKVLLQDAYTLSEFIFSPEHLGFPAHRRRKYMVLLRSDLIRWHDAVSDDPFLVFTQLFFTECRLLGSALFRAPASKVQAEIMRRAKQVHLPETRLDGRAWHFKHVLSPSRRALIVEWEDWVRKELDAPPKSRPDVIVQSTQRPLHQRTFSKLVPTLLRASQPWAVALQRSMLQDEKFEAQGFAIFCADDYPYRCPFADKLDSFCDQTKSVMAGNGMHVESIGCVLAFALACTVEKGG